MAAPTSETVWVSVKMPIELVGLHWLAMTVLNRSRAATFAARDRARDCMALYRRLMDGLTPEVVINPGPQDVTLTLAIASVTMPDRNPREIVYRVRHTLTSGQPIDGARAEYTAPSVWAIVEELKAANVPLPAGVAQWLYHAPVGAKLRASDDGRTLLTFTIEEVGRNGQAQKTAAPQTPTPTSAAQPAAPMADGRQTSMFDVKPGETEQ